MCGGPPASHQRTPVLPLIASAFTRPLVRCRAIHFRPQGRLSFAFAICALLLLCALSLTLDLCGLALDLSGMPFPARPPILDTPPINPVSELVFLFVILHFELFPVCLRVLR